MASCFSTIVTAHLFITAFFSIESNQVLGQRWSLKKVPKFWYCFGWSSLSHSQ